VTGDCDKELRSPYHAQSQAELVISRLTVKKRGGTMSLKDHEFVSNWYDRENRYKFAWEIERRLSKLEELHQDLKTTCHAHSEQKPLSVDKNGHVLEKDRSLIKYWDWEGKDVYGIFDCALKESGEIKIWARWQSHVKRDFRDHVEYMPQDRVTFVCDLPPACGDC